MQRIYTRKIYTDITLISFSFGIVSEQKIHGHKLSKMMTIP